MESAGSRPEKLALFLGGLQAGMLGAFFSAAWLALGSAFMGRGFWGAANAVASPLYGGLYHRGFHFSSIAGLALHVVAYSSLGGLTALGLRDETPRTRRTLSCIVLALAWFYLAYGLVWPYVAPAVIRAQPFSMAVVGHVIYGGILSRYPHYFRPLSEPERAQPPDPEPPPEPEPEPIPIPQTEVAPDPEV